MLHRISFVNMTIVMINSLPRIRYKYHLSPIFAFRSNSVKQIAMVNVEVAPVFESYIIRPEAGVSRDGGVW